jgi:hypothetical protein
LANKNKIGENSGRVNSRELYLSNTWAGILFFYYVVLFIFSSGLLLVMLLEPINDVDLLKNTLLLSASIAVSASCMAYIRKLYKLCFKLHEKKIDEETPFFKQYGTLIYFFTRPFFALLFSVIIVVGLKSGVLIATKGGVLDEGFLYISMFFSFYAGFFSGSFIRNLEDGADRRIRKLIG